MAFDQWNYQDHILRSMDRLESYRREHVSRIARSQPNGAPWMVSEIDGQLAALKLLLGGNQYSTANEALARIAELETEQPSVSVSDDADAKIRGWQVALRQEKALIEEAMQ